MRSLQVWLSDVRTRLLVFFVVLLAVSTVASNLAVREILQARASGAVDDSLNREVTEFQQLVREERDPRTGRPFGPGVRGVLDLALARNVPGEDQAFAVFLDGRPYRTSANDPVQARLLTEVVTLGGTLRSHRATAQTAAGGVRYVVTPVRVDGRIQGGFAVAKFVRGDQLRIAEAAQVAAGVSIIVLAVGTLLAFLLAGRVLAPLRRVTETTRALGESDLSRRVAVSGNDEVAQLGRTFNGMLDRLERAFSSRRELVRDAAHELQGPIATIRGHLELMGDEPEDRRATIALVSDELDRMGMFVEDLLLLARVEQGDFLEPRALDLGSFTVQLFAQLRGLADRDWALGEVGGGEVVADRQRVAQAVVNLARNAVTMTLPGDRIELGSACAGDEVRLAVSTAGAGLRAPPAGARAGAGEPGQGAAGLGLSIARAIAEGHGGRLEVDSRGEAGVSFTCVIPTVPASRAVPV